LQEQAMLPHSAPVSRRTSLKTILGALAVAGTAGCADLVPQGVGFALTPSPITDPSVYNFALNLEYLEAEYYRRGLTGEGLPANLTGPNPGRVTGGRRVPFRTGYLEEMFAEIAADEANHVAFLRRSIKSSPLVELSRPALDFENSFRAVGRAAGLGSDFDPFADEASFLLGAFLFEDVGVTAYAGGSDLIAGPRSLEGAAGILAVEGYHGGLVRTQIAEMGGEMIARADAISRARAAVENPNNRRQRPGVEGPLTKEQPIGAGEVFPGEIVVAPTDPQGRSFPRPPHDVLNIVFLDPSADANRGGFFPEGVKGVVRHAGRHDSGKAARA
jgi:hypothetical protein